MLSRLLILLFAALPLDQALACSCGRASPQQLLEGSPLIFAGRVLSVDMPKTARSGPGRAKLSVERLYKGVAAATVEIDFQANTGSSCDIGFREGAEEIVFAWPSRTMPERFTTGYCGRIAGYEAMRFLPLLDAYRLQVANARAAATDASREPTGLSALVSLLERHRDWLTIIDVLESAPPIPRDKAALDSKRGYAFMQIGRHERALAAFDGALAAEPNHPAAQAGRDQALITLGRIAEVSATRRDFARMTIEKSSMAGRDLSHANFDGATLRAVDLSGSNLTDARFSKAELTASVLRGTTLRRAQLVGLRSQRSDFTDANLSGANLTDAVLDFSRLDGADLTDARLRNVSLFGASLVGVKVGGADFEGARLGEADAAGTDFSGADLSNRELQGISFRDARLVGTDLRGALLSGPTRAARQNEALHGVGRAADLRGADLTAARLDGADLRFALFDCRTRWPESIDVARSLMVPVTSAACPGPLASTLITSGPRDLREQHGRIPARAPLRGPVIQKTSLQGAEFENANLSGFSFWQVDLSRARFKGADLRNASFGDAMVDGADFRGADLSGAWLSKMDFSKADLRGAILTGARFDAGSRWPAGFDPVAAGGEALPR